MDPCMAVVQRWFRQISVRTVTVLPANVFVSILNANYRILANVVHCMPKDLVVQCITIVVPILRVWLRRVTQIRWFRVIQYTIVTIWERQNYRRIKENVMRMGCHTLMDRSCQMIKVDHVRCVSVLEAMLCVRRRSVRHILETVSRWFLMVNVVPWVMNVVSIRTRLDGSIWLNYRFTIEKIHRSQFAFFSLIFFHKSGQEENKGLYLTLTPFICNLKAQI